MKLERKKELAAKALGVGKNRIALNVERLNEVKEAITKQDMRDLYVDGAIFIKEIKGSKMKVERRTRRQAGSIRKKVNLRKRNYMLLTRKLRAYLGELKKHGKLSQDKILKLRQEIRAKDFKSKRSLKERIAQEEKN